MVTAEQLACRWQGFKAQARQRWTQLVDQELDAVQGDVEALIASIQRCTGESREAIDQFLDSVAAAPCSTAHVAVNRVREYAHSAGEHFSDAYQQTAQSIRDGYQHAEAYVQRNPMPSIAIAFGAGLLGGVILSIVLRPR
jgi:ElaB/YqjD/DUF883 family membrane-anchored ribosome-binding protein